MSFLPYPLQSFIDQFAELPGIGPRQATRIAFWLLRQDPRELREFSETVKNLAERIGICDQCFFVYEKKGDEMRCDICRDSKRDQGIVAVVEKEIDLISIEKTKTFKGVYHVLGGTISPIDTEANKSLRIPELVKRLEKRKEYGDPIKEVILALSPTAEGDLTTQELKKKLAPLGVRITHLGIGLPRGAEVEFADVETLRNALDGRR